MSSNNLKETKVQVNNSTNTYLNHQSLPSRNTNTNLGKLFDPILRIKNAYKSDPWNQALFKSYNIQVTTLGNEHNRNTLINGINSLTNNVIQFKQLKSHYENNNNQFTKVDFDYFKNDLRRNNIVHFNQFTSKKTES